MCLWDVRLRRPQRRKHHRLKDHQRLKQLPPKQVQLKLQPTPLLRPPQRTHQKHQLMSLQKPRSKLQLNLPQWSKPLRRRKKWWLCAAMTDLVRRKPSLHQQGVLATNQAHGATMARPVAVAQTLPDLAVAAMHRAATTRLSNADHD